jgi:hypothetical protein
MSVYICNNCFSDNLQYVLIGKEKRPKLMCFDCKTIDDYFECDDLCANTIITLNKNGYITKFSCEGHYCSENRIYHPYIRFRNRISNELFNEVINNLNNKMNLTKFYIDENSISFYLCDRFDRNIFNKWKFELWMNIEEILIDLLQE